MKFGGGLMDNAPGIKKVTELIEEFSCEPLVVVVSALGKTTNALEKLYQQYLNGEPLEDGFFEIKKKHLSIVTQLFSKVDDDLRNCLDQLFEQLWSSLNAKYSNKYEAYDCIVSFGEELSSCIIYHYLKSINIKTNLVNAKCIIKTDSNFTNASVNWSYTSKTIDSRIVPLLESGKVVITQGFVGADKFGKSTTIGREGSDFTAAIIGNLLNADEVTIWKNVPGLMNADPARFSNAVKIDKLSYHEAIELAYYGASVIHPKTIQPLKQKNIPLFVRPYYNTDLLPTSITNDSSNDSVTSSIIIKDNQVLLSISTKDLSFIAEENLKQIFDVFSRNKTHINMMQNSAVSFSVCFKEDSVKLPGLLSDLQSEFAIKYNKGLILITVRNYTDDIIASLVGNKKVYLEQKSRVTVQLLIRES